jgi:hypothetical protein
VVTESALVKDENEYGLLKALGEARKRGKEICVIADAEWGREDKSALKRLFAEGVEVRFGLRIHNKTLCCDDDVLIEGSFNWFSAARRENLDRSNFSLRYDSPTLKPLIDRIWLRMQERVQTY